MAKKKKDDEQDEMSDGSIAVNDAWTGMLAISLLALVVASGFLLYDYLQMSGEPKLYNFTTKLPSAPPKVVQPPPPGENKDKDKEKDKDMEKDKEKDKDMEKDKDKEKDKASLQTPSTELALNRRVFGDELSMRSEQTVFSAIRRPQPILPRRK